MCTTGYSQKKKKFMFRIVYCVFLICLITAAVQAQTTVSGKITDQYAGPLRAVTVHLLNTSISVSSDKEGNFRIADLRPGNYIIELSAIGYASLVREITVDKNNTPLLFSMQNSMLQLDAVTVTAEKREELLQRIPASVTVLNAKQVQDFNMWDIKQLTGIVPNLYSGNSGDMRNVTSIRGITTTSYDPAVATYIDGVNQFSLDTYIAQLFDVERIEILRGPQGTLYGRNAMGGVINIITKQPSNRVEGFAELTAGNYGQQRYTAGIRVPLIKDKLYIGAAGTFDKRNGYYTNQFNNSSFDKQSSFNGNYFIKYKPVASWSLLLNVKHQDNRNDGAFSLVNGPGDALKNPFQLNQNAVAKMIDNTFDASLSAHHNGSKVDFSVQLAWQTNYRYYNAPLDADFSPIDGVTIINNYGKPFNTVKVITDEMRFNSPVNKNSPLSWTAGSYFFHQYNPGKQATHFGRDAGLLGVPDTNFATINTTTVKNTGFALYGQVNYKLSKKLELIAGLRYDDEYKRLDVKGEYQKDGQNVLVTRPDTSGSANFSALSPKLALQYQVLPSSNVYASYSRGYRTGGLTQLSSDPSQPPLYPYSPEYSNNIEIGIKNNFFNNKLAINITGFLTYVNNTQVPTLILPDAITVTKNTGSLISKGAEVEIAVKPLKGLQFNYNFGYTHARYSSLKLASNGQTVNLNGNRQIFTPDITSLLAVQYSYMLFPKQQVMAVARGEWNYLGIEYFDLANTIRQSSHSIINTRIGISSPHIEVFFWARNIANTKYIEYAYDFGAVHLGNPETRGITLRTTL